MSTGSSVQTLLTSYQPPILQSEWLGTRSVPMDDGAGHRDKSVGHGCELPPSRKDSNLKEGGMYFKINGLNLHLEDRGNSDGLPLVFLHSWAGSARSWKYVVDALPSGLRTITVDHRGWGRSESHSSGFDLAGLASDAKEVVKALKLDRYVLIGHSMGGKLRAKELHYIQPPVIVGAVYDSFGIDVHVSGLDNFAPAGTSVDESGRRRRHKRADFARSVPVTDVED